ncbi:MAG TPA: ABC transporter permease [Candidatus Baltobacteraceae bacterium]|nr:ABC transporter permease [Candidatus Baltobacteraceae bacterium]
MTRILAYLIEASEALWRNRTRSVLTILGMIIGTASIIAVFGISKGASSGIASTISSFGVSPVFIYADPTQDYPDQAQIQFRDVAAVRIALADRAYEVMPLYQRTWPIRYGNKKLYITASGDGAYHPDTLMMAEGRKFTQEDVDSASRVVVLSNDVAHTLFGNDPALGKDVTVNGTHFSVSGVYPALQGSFFNAVAGSNAITIPFTTVHRIMPGPPDGLLIYPSDPANANPAIAIAKNVLRHIHGARAQYADQNGQSQVQSFESALSVVGTGLSAIGGVALVVAGIGIMNIMLVSVTERTREIGIRKSIGASRNDIALQFLLEAILLALAGGGSGMLLGLGITIAGAELISKQLGAIIIPYVLIVCLAIGFSTAVGLIFGMYPALRAASMDPIEALRS